MPVGRLFLLCSIAQEPIGRAGIRPPFCLSLLVKVDLSVLLENCSLNYLVFGAPRTVRTAWQTMRGMGVTCHETLRTARLTGRGMRERCGAGQELHVKVVHSV